MAWPWGGAGRWGPRPLRQRWVPASRPSGAPSTCQTPRPSPGTARGSCWSLRSEIAQQTRLSNSYPGYLWAGWRTGDMWWWTVRWPGEQSPDQWEEFIIGILTNQRPGSPWRWGRCLRRPRPRTPRAPAPAWSWTPHRTPGPALWPPR